MRGVVLAAFALGLLGGCSNYRVGYRPVVEDRVIAAPIFENRTLRRGLEYQLAGHLRQRILDATPLHLGGVEDTDVRVEGAIVAVSEGVVIPDRVAQNPPIESSLSVTVEVRVIDRRRRSPVVPLTTFTENESFVATFGQSRESASDRALKKIAERIVDLLEDGWRLWDE